MRTRMIPLCICVIVGNAAMAAEPASPAASPAGAVVLDGNSLWRYFTVSRCSYVRTADGKLEPRDISWYWGGIRSTPASPTASSPLPPGDWAGPAFDDGLWPRVRLPQPVLTVSGANPRPFYAPYATVRVVLRGKFEVADPTRVQSCSLSLDYWGGAVVYVNGKEVARGHAPDDKPGPEAVAEDYPLEAFTTPEGKPLRVGDAKSRDRLALRERRLADVKIPAGLLRKGTNVLAIEVRQAPVPEVIARGVGQESSGCGWPPIGLLNARLTVSPAGAATPNLQRPKDAAGGSPVQVWNCAPYDTITAFDYGEPVDPLRPISVTAARNGVFSGRLVVSSDQAIKGLKVAVADLVWTGQSLSLSGRGEGEGAGRGSREGPAPSPQPSPLKGEGAGRIPAAAVRVRYAEPAAPDKSWVQPYRFDGLLDAIPAEIPVIKATPAAQNYAGLPVDRKGLAAGAVADLWFTVRVPKDAPPGAYEGAVTVAADGLKPTTVPLKVTVCDWTLADPRDLRLHTFAQFSEDSEARFYGVPLWSDRHFELLGKTMALMAEVNSLQVPMDLSIDFYGLGGNQESVVRWIKEADNSYKYDFSVFDKYLDCVAKAIGKPLPLRLNCWPELDKTGQSQACGKMVTRLDPATGKLEPMEAPAPGTPEALAFWKPVLDEVRKRIEARGWFDVTAQGANSYCYGVAPAVVSMYKKIWPDGVWAYTAHNGVLGSSFKGTEKDVSMPVRYADCIWNQGRLTARGYRALLKPRAGYWCFTHRGSRDGLPLTALRDIPEGEIMRGHDGWSDFGADFFPVKNARGQRAAVGNGRGTGGPNDGTLALLAPGPDGAIATERFEMLREGIQLGEAILFIQRALDENKITGDLAERANRYLDERGEAFARNWLSGRSEKDTLLLALAGEVAKVVK